MNRKIVNNDNLHKVLLVANPNTSEEHIKKILIDNNHDWILTYTTLQNPGLSTEFLEYLIPFCKGFSIISRLANHPNTNEKLQLQLLKRCRNDVGYVKNIIVYKLKTETNKRFALMIMNKSQ